MHLQNFWQTFSEVHLKFLKVALGNFIMKLLIKSSTWERGSLTGEFHAEFRWEVKKFIASEVHTINFGVLVGMSLNFLRRCG